MSSDEVLQDAQPFGLGQPGEPLGEGVARARRSGAGFRGGRQGCLDGGEFVEERPGGGRR